MSNGVRGSLNPVYVCVTHTNPIIHIFLQATRLLSLQPEILAKKSNNTLANAEPKIGLFLSKQLIFAFRVNIKYKTK